MSIVFLDQLTVHYESLGRGRPVVFLHTWIGSWRYWVQSMQLVSGSHTAYAVDFFGFGDTARDPQAYSVERQASLVEGFVDQMGIDRIALVSHGLGAQVGFCFAARHPARVARVLAVAAALDPLSLDGRLQTAGVRDLQTLVAGNGSGLAELLPDPTAIDPRAVAAPSDYGLINAGVGALRDAGVPVLFVFGLNDPLLHAPSPEHVLAIGPNVEQVVFPESGHFPMIDAADPFHRLLVDFLALEPGASPRGLQPKEEWHRRLR